jgi:hypothetical protein
VLNIMLFSRVQVAVCRQAHKWMAVCSHARARSACQLARAKTSQTSGLKSGLNESTIILRLQSGMVTNCYMDSITDR